MISIPLWHLILYVLAGVALGAVTAILTLARGKVVIDQAGAAPVSRASNKAPGSVKSLAAAATRGERVKAFLKNRIASKRSVTVDEAAKALSVSPRRIRRLLDDNILVSVPASEGGRLVSPVSVLDLIVRRETAETARQQLLEDPLSPAEKEPEAVESTEKPEPGPRQLYWYYVDGHDKPLRSIREALQTLGLTYAYTGWSDIPGNIKAKIRRERV